MIDAAMQIVICCCALAVTAGYVCRLGMLDATQHGLQVVLMHWALSSSTVLAGVNAWRLQAGPEDALIVLGAGLWLSISLRSWAHGVPEHYRRPTASEP